MTADASTMLQDHLKSLRMPTSAFIGGHAVAAASGKTFATLNPATGQVLARIAECDCAEIDMAVRAATAAFEGPWGRMRPSERKRLLFAFADLIDAHREELALLETLESGKPIADTRCIDVPDTANTIRWHAEAIDKINDDLTPTGPDVVSMVVREALGVVAAVLPWNFPLMMAAWKLGPMLATGNTVVLKPAEQTSMSTIRLAELAVEAGIPDGVLNVVPGFGETVGQAIGMHPGIACVAFTGSTETGRRFLTYSASSNLKRVLLECGGKNPMIVLQDAADLDAVAGHAVNAAFWNGGQNCSAASRILIHRSRADELLQAMLDRSGEWAVGNPLDPATKIGPMIESEHLGRIDGYVSDAEQNGARSIPFGRQTDRDKNGFYAQPKIMRGVNRRSRMFSEEVFGPVVSLHTFETADEAIELANETCYGLAASLFTTNVRSANRYAKAIKAGIVTVNCYGEGDLTAPFGGYKQSGFWGRDKSLIAHDQYCERKTIWMDVA